MPISDFLTQVCNVRLQSTAQGRSGSPVREPHEVILAGVPCLVREIKGTSSLENGSRTMDRKLRLYLDPGDLPGDFRLTTRHQVEVLADPPGVNRILVPTSVVDVNSMHRLLQIDCDERPV